MKLPQIKSLRKEALTGKEELPSWVDSLIKIFNGAIEPVVSAITGRLTFKDNFSCRIVELAFNQGVELEVSPGTEKVGKVSGVIPLGCQAGYLVSHFGFTLMQKGNVGVTLGFATASGGTISSVPAGTEVKATIMILIG